MKMKFCLVKEKMLKIFIKKFKELCLVDNIIKKGLSGLMSLKDLQLLWLFMNQHLKKIISLIVEL